MRRGDASVAFAQDPVLDLLGRDVFFKLIKSLMWSAKLNVASFLILVRAVLMTKCRMNARLCLHTSVFPVLRV